MVNFELPKKKTKKEIERNEKNRNELPEEQQKESNCSLTTHRYFSLGKKWISCRGEKKRIYSIFVFFASNLLACVCCARSGISSISRENAVLLRWWRLPSLALNTAKGMTCTKQPTNTRMLCIFSVSFTLRRFFSLLKLSIINNKNMFVCVWKCFQNVLKRQKSRSNLN